MEKGLPRAEAYDIVQRCAMQTWSEGTDFKANLLKDKKLVRCFSAKELDSLFSLDYYLRNVNKIFKRVGL